MGKKLEGKTIVISGGTKGVGKNAVWECARQGANVVFGGRDEAAAEAIIKKLGVLREKVVFIRTDLRDFDSYSLLFDTASKTFGAVDGFVNYAGVVTAAPLTECSEEIYDSIFDVNIKAAFFCCQNALKHMLKRGGGSIILCGSPHAWGGEIDRAAYAVSKGALLILSEHIAHNYASNHIRCNHLVLGWTITEGELELRRNKGMTEQELRSTVAKIAPIGRIIEPDEYLPTLIYLLSDDSLIMTGANIRVTGGLYF